MTEYDVHSPLVRLLGRLDESQSPVCLDWTGSGFEALLRGSELWAEVEATAPQPGMWLAGLVDGYPVTRFLAPCERRWIPLAHGMSAERTHRVSLIKETQAMPGAPEATVRLHAVRCDGELLPLPAPKWRVEFIGDSLTSAEGTLAPMGNDEWLSMWFSGCANYSHYACRELDAERRVLSQSGYGVCWDYQGSRAGSMADGYRKIAGVYAGEAAEARGCLKDYDFSAWPADAVCIRLLSNDVGGMRRMERVDELSGELVRGAADFIRTVRDCNPAAKIVWLLPSSASLPQLGVRAVDLAREQGVRQVYAFSLPDYLAQDMGARNHPNAAYNERAGHLLAQYLRILLS